VGVFEQSTSRTLLEEMPSVYGVDLPELIHGANLEMQIVDGRLALCARDRAESLVYANLLQTQDGELRAEAATILSQDALDEPADAQQWLGMDYDQLIQTGDLESSSHQLLKLQLWTNADFLPILQAHIENGYRFLRVGAYPPLYRRLRLLEIIAELQSGVAVSALHIGPRAHYSTLVSGIWQLYPGSLVCFPMTVRHQPLAMVYMTPVGSQVVMLPPKGKVFKRPMQLFTWPVGTVGQVIQGSVIGIYRGAGKPWEGEGALEILQSCVLGAHSLLDWVSDPATWQDENGFFHGDELWLAWTSLSQGMAALTALAETWNGSSSLWDAFRALGILQGVWAGSDERSVKLSDLLRPDHLGGHAALNISHARLRE
jgi:hypothetical protein